jgi:hypothetical protein
VPSPFVHYLATNEDARSFENSSLKKEIILREYQYFEGIYHERDYKRNITISATILFVREEREKKKIKQTF